MIKENIQEVILKEEMKSSYIGYAMSVVIGRAIPDVRDGLKPVHRRLIYAMADNNWDFSSPHVKCAKIVGECFVKGTLVNTINGLKSIEDISIGDSVYTHNGAKQVTKLYEMPEQELFQIELENGLQNVCTKGQRLKIFTPELKYVWKNPNELNIGDYIVCRSKYNPTTNSIRIGDILFDEDLAYFIGLFLADGWIDRDNKRGYHRIAIASDTIEVLEKIQKILISKFNHKENILKKTENFFYIRINKNELNSQLINTFNLEDKYSYNIKIPPFLYNSPANLIFAFFSGFLEGDGHVHKNRSVLSVCSIFERFIRDLQVLLFSIGINSCIYLEKKKTHYLQGKLVRGNYDIFSLEITGIDFSKIKDQIKIQNLKKNRNLKKERKYIASKFEEIPYLGKFIFTEFSEKHLGGGWYQDKDGNKIRIGIKYPDGTKIRYQKNLKEEIRIYKSTLNILNIKRKMELIGSKYLDIINKITQNDYSFIKIKEIIKKSSEKTYDIQVKDNHQFIANGMIVHNCLGNYHPHGDAAVYNSLVRMGQNFSLRYPLIDPQGNFGSIDGDPPAAYRYTEARLSRIANELIEDLEKDTVNFQPNFDSSSKEPIYLPAKLPNMLLNGTKGIAVGMATSMPPHNLKEVCQGIISTIDNPDISVVELMELIKGPDFPTGGIITSTSGIYNAYAYGKGNIPLRGRIEEETKGKIKNLIISEIPYLLNKTTLIEGIAKLIRDGVLKDIRDLRDESDRKGMRIVLELKKGAQTPIIKNTLFKRTRLFANFNVVNLVLINDGKQPKILNLKELIKEYIKHRSDIIFRKAAFQVKKAKDRLHKVDGLIIALNDIDNVVNIIKSSNDSKDARTKLKDKYKLSDIQVKAILEMPLSRLTNLETKKLKDEQNSLNQQIIELKKILESKEIRLAIIKKELIELSNKYGDDRRTEIVEEEISDIAKKDLVKKEPTMVILTKNHYIKRMSPQDYRTQRRGGRGKRGMTINEEDFISDLFVCSTHDTILFFTSKGRVYTIKCFEVPLQQRTAKGRPIINLIRIREGEEISSMIPINNFDTNDFLIMITKKGIAKKIQLKKFSKIPKSGLRAQGIRPNDNLVSVKMLSNELQDIFIATKLGFAIRFDESELKEQRRTTMGYKGLSLREGDEVIEGLLVNIDDIILTLSQKGYGQRTYVKEYRKTRRAAKGVKNIKLTKIIQDKVIDVKISTEEDILVGTEQGQVIRVPIDSIRITHRPSKGVRVIKLYENDSVTSIGKCEKQIKESKEIE